MNRPRSSPRSSPTKRSVLLRVLCLGNDSLADDALGHEVARRLQQFASNDAEVVSTPESGLHLLEHVLDTRKLVVIDTIQTGKVPAGTILQFHDRELQTAPGASPHYVGLSEVLAVARQLHLPVAEDVVILAVEAEDCLTFGTTMCLAVRSAIPKLVRTVKKMMRIPAELQPG